MRVLLTGAAGLTGGEVCRRLLAAGHDVTAVVRRPGSRPFVPAGAEVAVADCRDHERMRELLVTHQAFVHVAGIVLGRDLARSGALAAPEHVVAVSSAAVRSRHRASAAAYRAGEDALRAARPELVLLRPTMIYGARRDRNVHHVIAFARRFRFLPLFGDGKGLVQPVHYEDVAAAAVALVGVSAPDPLDIGASSPLTLRAAAEAVLAAVGVPPRLLRVPYGSALTVARVVDAFRGSRLAERIERMLEDRTADNTALVRLTGIVPRSFEAGVIQQAAAEVSASSR